MLLAIRKLAYMMSRKEKISLLKLLFLIIIMTILDVVGIASIIPFFNLASDPNNIYNNKYLNLIYEQLNFNSENNFLILAGFLTVLAFTAGSLTRLYTQTKIFKFAYYFEYGLAQRILDKTVLTNYEYFLNKHSSEFGEKILSRIENLISGFILPLLTILTNSFLLIIIFSSLLIIDFNVTIGLIISLSIFYFLVTFKLRNYVKTLGEKRLKTHKNKFKIISELFGSIKEIKIFNSENIFLNKYSQVSSQFAKYQYSAKSVSIIPRTGIELIFIATLILVILIKVVITGENLLSIISYLSVYVLAVYKLLPSLQQIFNMNLILKYNLPLLNNLFSEYHEIEKKKISKNIRKINILNNIKLENINYYYPGSEISSLRNLNIQFNVDKSTAIVGSSGAGKSTLIEVLTGLLRVQNGNILIDKKIVNNNNFNKWNHNFSIVPQSVFILDDTIAANIAFGVESNSLSMERIRFASKIACIDKLIENDLPHKYQTILGERGVRLSGGQRQRIAIARAIYRESKFIIFDEASSELDSITEKNILSNMKNYKSGGIISIAHRLSTIKDFDEIVLIKDGCILAKGKYDELMNIEEFRMLNQNSKNF